MREFMSAVEPTLAFRGSILEVFADGADRDDAALYEVSPGQLLAVTTDFGTPIGTDARKWGRVAAQSALSDVFAMGARPLLALSVMAVPEHLGVDLMVELTAGAIATLAESGTPLVGGHTVRSEVPLFGLCVVGQVPADQVILLRNAVPGQVLVATKPLGTGIVIAGARAGVASRGLIEAAEEVMMSSNRLAAELATTYGIVAGTDITGFGFVGHLHNMMEASGCSARVQLPAVPVISGVVELLDEHGVVPNSAESNLFALAELVEWARVPYVSRLVLADPQTSGGLLLSAEDAVARTFVEVCAEKGLPAFVVGEVVDGTPGSIVVES
jgi:selenide,water dikinase